MEEKNLILAIDVGTTETKAVLVSPDGYIDSRQMSCTLSYPEHACVEQSPDELAGAIYGTAREVLAAHPECLPRLAAMAFTSQMQNAIPIGKDGRPLMNSMTWMDERAAAFVREELLRGLVKIEGYPLSRILRFIPITGGMPGTTGKDTVCKIAWLKKNRPEIYDATHRFLDVKDYAVFLATGNFVTSYDMAYVTWLMDTRGDQKKWHWSDSIHRMFGLDPGKMPDLRASTAVAGKVTGEFSAKTGVPEGLPVVNGSGDMLTSAIGSGAIEPGRIHVNIGTAG
ncbi:MAG: hypothetical protein KA369_17290 [Spirochaetes bacterium]|nr:hypothetical protein [Spirochaetota bacterium]